MSNEIWKDIKGYENKYQISNFGRVKSLKRWSGTKFYDREYILVNYINKKNGYVYVYLTKDNKSKNIRLHKLVAEAFIPNPHNHTQINHIDGNKENNNKDNLEWCNSSYNITDMYKRKGVYDKHKLIIEDYKNGLNKKELSKKYNLSYEQIRLIVKG